ncbi:hypothetical protein JCM19237_1021 [Photobacterium aphoticum]|uniref:Uncharacterized protein n=1 Tax=Photobacterium aphoticum TaxID=754436 RepID=A0A090QR96_9GAMM|nr:hypothetical protein JCM19237_1021 [Photobacterium aphoticum]
MADTTDFLMIALHTGALRMKKKVIALAALIALSVGGFTYLTPSHAIHTDNAYIKADITTVSPQVGGR